MKYYFIISTFILSLSIFANVYEKESSSIFSRDVQAFINEAVITNCDQEGWLYGAFNEKIDGNIYSTDISVGEDYAFESYIVVKRNGAELELEEIECPRFYSNWDY